MGQPGTEVISADALAARGSAPAIRSQSETLSYQTLAERALEVCRALKDLGIGPGDAVGLVSIGRGTEEVIGLTALMIHRAVVVPLDPGAPARRLASILEGQGVRVVITDDNPRAVTLYKGLQQQLKGALGRVELTPTGIGAVTAAPKLASASPPRTDLACVLHTSGSTGSPKPVPITQVGLEAFTGWAADLIDLGEADTVLRVAELTFDLAWFDHIATLRRGATLAIMSRRELAAGRAIVDAVDALSPSVIYGVPSLFMKMTSVLTDSRSLKVAPRAILFAGEVFPIRAFSAFAHHLPKARLINLYGPTETNVCTFHEVICPVADGEVEIPIGVACPYAHCELRDESDSEQPIVGDGIGELWVSGPTTLGGGPLATRDRVERKNDLFYFRGRIDRVVKIRGYRVEPLEIEMALCEHPNVEQAAVVTRDDPKLGLSLSAFVTVRGSEPTDARILRRHLMDRLPGYMVPDAVRVAESLPLTTTGKVDTSALTKLAQTTS